MWELPPVISRYAISCLHRRFHFAILGSCKQQQNNNMRILLFWKSRNGKYGRYFVFMIWNKNAQKLLYIRLSTLNVLQKWTSFDAEMQQHTLGNCKMLLRIIVKTVSFDDVFIHLVTYFLSRCYKPYKWKKMKASYPIFSHFFRKKTLSWSDFIWTSLFVRRFIFPLSSVARGVKGRICNI